MVVSLQAQDAKEAALGAQVAQDVRQHTTPVVNPAIQSYAERVGAGLAAPECWLMPWRISPTATRPECMPDANSSISGASRWFLRAAGTEQVMATRPVNRMQPANSVFSSLPPRDERVAELVQAVSALPSETHPASDEEFTRMQEEVRKLEPVPPPTLRRTPPSLLRPGERN